MGRIFEPKNLDELKKMVEPYLSKPEEIVPRGKTINVFIMIKALTPLLIRTEGQGDLTTFRVGNVSVPAILNTKIQAMLRRKTLQILRYHYDKSSSIRQHVDNIVGEPWNCIVNVTAGGSNIGYCGKCPACMIYGFAVQKEGGYNVKSRVEGDVYYATIREEESTFTFTRNAVDEALKITGQALLQDRAVKPGTIFIGKIALKNLTWNEFLLVMNALLSIDRLGAVQTHFGRVKITLTGLIASPYEVGSGYEVALKILATGKKDEASIKSIYKEYIRELGESTPDSTYTVVEDLGDIILRGSNLEEVVVNAWNDAKTKREEIEKLFGGEKKSKKKK